jgi:viroplasmin and RNaseH domain-containing protein
MSKAKKYYVVWQGNQPGIYDSWENCQREIRGYPDAKFKSYNSLDEARKAYKDPDSVISEPKKNITTLSGAGKNRVSMKTGMMRKLQLRVFQNRSTKLLEVNN